MVPTIVHFPTIATTGSFGKNNDIFLLNDKYDEIYAIGIRGLRSSYYRSFEVYSKTQLINLIFCETCTKESIRIPPRPMNRRGGSPPTPPPPPPPPPPQNPLAALEQANANMMAGITALLEQQATRPRLSHEEDVAKRFQKKGLKEFLG
ncbi:uncharacterized protein [Henckelia pumila]|uniref:uncharacterized protein n=1 Tax=Henckelia pumila TaxID=405737 RepID=UPI003C6DFD86